MNLINHFFTSAIAVEASYLYNVVASFLLANKDNSLLSASEMESKLEHSIAAQMFSDGHNYVASPVIIPIKHPIVKYSTYGCVGTTILKKWVEALDQDDRVSHIIFDIDSGGGMVSGTQELCDTIVACKTPTISYTSGMACSAAQHIFSSAQLCVASPYADLLGSIGTLISYQDFDAMFEKLGAKIYEIYAPSSSEKNKIFRNLKAGNTTDIEAYLEEYAQEFIADMKRLRKDKIKDDGLIFKGKTYKPKQAKQVGLVDEIMTFEQLCEQL